MPHESMSPRERWLAVLTRQKPDRTPMDYWSTPEFSARLIRHLKLSRKSEKELVQDLNRPGRSIHHLNEGRLALQTALENLHVDYVVSVGPRYAGPTIPTDTDVFGCTYRTINYGSGEYSEVVTNPLAKFNTVEEIEKNYIWPDPDWWDYKSLPEQIKGREMYPIKGGGSEPFLTYKSLRGQEQAMMDLALNPEIVHYCLDKLFELAYQNTLRVQPGYPRKSDADLCG